MLFYQDLIHSTLTENRSGKAVIKIAFSLKLTPLKNKKSPITDSQKSVIGDHRQIPDTPHECRI